MIRKISSRVREAGNSLINGGPSSQEGQFPYYLDSGKNYGDGEMGAYLGTPASTSMGEYKEKLPESTIPVGRDIFDEGVPAGVYMPVNGPRINPMAPPVQDTVGPSEIPFIYGAGFPFEGSDTENKEMFKTYPGAR